jgi:hypothetical protein
MSTRGMQETELEALRQLADAAERIFDHEGIHTKTPVQILQEALRSTQDDLTMLSSCESSDSMFYRRAELRIDLALALAEYRATFGRVSP